MIEEIVGDYMDHVVINPPTFVYEMLNIGPRNSFDHEESYHIM